MDPFIQGKKIDFNEEINIHEKENRNLQNIEFFQNSANNYGNEFMGQMNNVNRNIPNNNAGDINNKNISIKEENEINTQQIKTKSDINIKQNNRINQAKCICTKTGCKKKYCSCFAQGIKCNGCDCKNCENTASTGKKYTQDQVDININYENLNISNTIKGQRVICNCTKSNCMKKYCECFKQGIDCNKLCRCRDCKNINGVGINNINNNYNYIQNNINLINENINNYPGRQNWNPESSRYNNPNLDFNNPINYQSEAFGICIKKEKLKIIPRKITLNETNNINNNEFFQSPTFSGRKRGRDKMDSANMMTCPTSKSSNRKRNGISNVNKNIPHKKLQLN